MKKQLLAGRANGSSPASTAQQSTPPTPSPAQCAEARKDASDPPALRRSAPLQLVPTPVRSDAPPPVVVALSEVSICDMDDTSFAEVSSPGFQFQLLHCQECI